MHECLLPISQALLMWCQQRKLGASVAWGAQAVMLSRCDIAPLDLQDAKPQGTVARAVHELTCPTYAQTIRGCNHFNCVAILHATFNHATITNSPTLLCSSHHQISMHMQITCTHIPTSQPRTHAYLYARITRTKNFKVCLFCHTSICNC